MRIKTKVGEIFTPDLEQVGPRTKYWVEALQDLLKVDELYCVMGAALQEAYNAGAMNAILGMKFPKGEVIDAEATVVTQAGGEEPEAEGPEPAEPDVPSDGSGPVQPAAEAPDVPGCVPESGREPVDAEEVEEGPRS